MSNETRRIMLVEDEKAIRDAVTAYLERENYWVTAIGDGQDALDEFAKHHFDLIILDLMLPRVPGERVDCLLGGDGGARRAGRKIHQRYPAVCGHGVSAGLDGVSGGQ